MSLAAGFMACGPLLVDFYDRPELLPICFALAPRFAGPPRHGSLQGRKRGTKSGAKSRATDFGSRGGLTGWGLAGGDDGLEPLLF